MKGKQKVICFLSLLSGVSGCAVQIDKESYANALSSGNFEIIEEQEKAGIIRSNEYNGDGLLPIHIATKSKNIPLIDFLLKTGSNINSVTKAGKTPIEIALEDSNGMIFDHLLRNGAELNIYKLDLFDKGIDNRNLVIKNYFKRVFNRDVESVFNSIDAGDLAAVEKLLDKSGLLVHEKRDGLSPLHYAIYNGKAEMVELLLQKGANPNITPDTHLSALHIVTSKKFTKTDSRAEIVSLLIQHGADINEQVGAGGSNDRYDNRVGNTALLNAAATNLTREVEILLTAGANTEISNIHGSTPVLAAAQNGNIEIIKLLAKHDANLHKIDKYGVGAMQEAADTRLDKSRDKGRVALVKYLLDRGVQVNTSDSHGFTPLHMAIRMPELVSVLINGGANVDAQNEYGHTSLHLLTNHYAGPNPLPVVKLLLKAGANPNVQDEDGNTPLIDAATNIKDYRNEFINELIAGGASAKIKNNSELSALSVYLDSHHFMPETGIALIKAGADVNEKNSNNFSVLMRAAVYGKFDVAQRLVAQGAKVNDKTKKGWTALHFTGDPSLIPRSAMGRYGIEKKEAILKQADIARILIDKGASLESKTSSGLTPLMIAAANGSMPVVKAMIAGGANVKEYDNKSNQALDYAKGGGHMDIHDYLLQRFY